MNQTIQTTGIIRKRGQFTIPDQIRKNFDWLDTDSVVNVSVLPEAPNKFIVEPYSQIQKKVDWDNLWKQIKKVRSFKGNGKPISLSKFIAQDRISGHSI